MSVPAEGYKYSQCSFKDEDKVKIDKILSYIQDKLNTIGLEDYFESGAVAKLDDVPFKTLYEISTSWEKLMYQLESISYKMLVVREYRMLSKLIELSKDKSNQITEVIQTLEENLRTDYSEIISANSFFSEYFTYKEFKNTFTVMTSADTVSFNYLAELKGQNMFKAIRRKIIADKANIHSLLSDPNKIIHINSIKNEDEKTYNLLRSEFFVTLCDEALKIKVPYGKKTQTEIIRPAHAMAKTLKLERTEIVYLTVSLDPISDVEIELGQVIEFNNGMKFDVTKTQQVLEREMFYQLELDKISSCNLLVPFYFSFIRCNLVKEQRSSYSKINDNSLIEQVSEIAKK